MIYQDEDTGPIKWTSSIYSRSRPK